MPAILDVMDPSTVKVPAFTVVGPEKVLTPSMVRFPAPSFVSPPVPDIAPRMSLRVLIEGDRCVVDDVSLQACRTALQRATVHGGAAAVSVRASQDQCAGIVLFREPVPDITPVYVPELA